ncbi:MAG: hypothetical protein LC754_16075 [Acidobacteria bacterium]|nr:hypothetical protein [Acidobacteriota bacterium]
MTDTQNSEERQAIRDIVAVLQRCGANAVSVQPLEEVAREWFVAGFADAEEVEDWLHARCFTPAGAQSLESAGITPEQAGIRTAAGAGDYEDTIGFKLMNGDLSFDEARRIITSDFWNS